MSCSGANVTASQLQGRVSCPHVDAVRIRARECCACPVLAFRSRTGFESVRSRRAPEAAVALWAFLHGMATLEAAGIFGERKPLSSFKFGLELWLNLLTSAVNRNEHRRQTCEHHLLQQWCLPRVKGISRHSAFRCPSPAVQGAGSHKLSDGPG